MMPHDNSSRTMNLMRGTGDSIEVEKRYDNDCNSAKRNQPNDSYRPTLQIGVADGVGAGLSGIVTARLRLSSIFFLSPAASYASARSRWFPNGFVA